MTLRQPYSSQYLFAACGLTRSITIFASVSMARFYIELGILQASTAIYFNFETSFVDYFILTIVATFF